MAQKLSLNDYLMCIKGMDISTLVKTLLGQKVAYLSGYYNDPKKRFEPISRLLEILDNSDDFPSVLKGQLFRENAVRYYEGLNMAVYVQMLKEDKKTEPLHASRDTSCVLGEGMEEHGEPYRGEEDPLKQEMMIIHQYGSTRGSSL